MRERQEPAHARACEQFIDSNWHLICNSAREILGRHQYEDSELKGIATIAFYDAFEKRGAIKKSKDTSIFVFWLEKHLHEFRVEAGDTVFTDGETPFNGTEDADFEFSADIYAFQSVSSQDVTDTVYSGRLFGSLTNIDGECEKADDEGALVGQAPSLGVDLNLLNGAAPLRLKSVLAAINDRHKGDDIISALKNHYGTEDIKRATAAFIADIKGLSCKGYTLYIATCVNGSTRKLLICSDGSLDLRAHLAEYGVMVSLDELDLENIWDTLMALA